MGRAAKISIQKYKTNMEEADFCLFNMFFTAATRLYMYDL